jgi:transposase
LAGRWGAIGNGFGIGCTAFGRCGYQDCRIVRVRDVRRSFPPEERHELLGLACHPAAELAAARSHWALRPLAEAAGRWRFVRQPVSKSTVGRWLQQASLKPHRVRRWLHSPDPDFRLKVRRVVRLYMNPPHGTRVICVDEKTQIQILERLHPGRPMGRGRPQRIEEHYRRHGILAVLGGWDVRKGQIVVKVRRRRRACEFLELLQAIRCRWPRGRLVIVADNLSTHKTPAIRTWIAAQAGRVRFEFLPLHASWLNQIEIWFSILERQVLARASDSSYRERAARIRRFAHHWNRIARPFRWTFKGYPLCP